MRSFAGNSTYPENGYPIFWCGAIAPPMDRYQHTQYDKTRIRVWCGTYEDEMKKTSSFDFVSSRVIVDLSVYPKS